MKKAFILLFLFIFYKGASQSSPIKKIIEDFNKDGIKDTLRCDYFDGNAVTNIINGKTNELFKSDYFYHFGETAFLNSLSSNFFKRENKYFFEKLKKHRFSYGEREKNDPSLNWILNSIKSKKVLTIDNNSSFNFITNPKPNWLSKEIKLPGNYYRNFSKKEIFDIYGNEITKRIKTAYDSKDHLEKFFNNSNYFLAYKSGLLNGEALLPIEFKLATKSNTYSIHKIKHAIYVQKGKKRKWLFITNLITGAPGKLRWASIGKIQIIDKYVVLEHRLPVSGEGNIYIINIETGVCGKLKFAFRTYESNFNPKEAGSFIIRDDNIIYLTTQNEKPITLKLPIIFTELDKQHIINYN